MHRVVQVRGRIVLDAGVHAGELAASRRFGRLELRDPLLTPIEVGQERLKLGAPMLVDRRHGTVARQGLHFETESVKRFGLLGNLLLKLGPLVGECVDARLERLRNLERRRDLGQPQEAERVVPALSNRAGARVLGAGWRALACESVVRVQAEEAAVAIHPADAVVDDDRAPGAGHLAGGSRLVRRRANDPTVASGVVDEGHAQGTVMRVPRSPGSGWPSVSRQKTRMPFRNAINGPAAGSGAVVMYSPCSKYAACEPAPANTTR